MDLVTIEPSKVIYLTQLVRPIGQLYLPEAAFKVTQRYMFAKYPSISDFEKQVFSFGMGKFEDIQIEDLSIYPDGLIVTSRTNTKVIDRFVDDLLQWCESEFGLVETIIAKPSRWYESVLIVKSNLNLMNIIQPKREVLDLVNKRWNKSNSEGDFQFVSFHLDCDPSDFPGRRRPVPLSIERRAGSIFADNVFFSSAPFPTDEHLAVLAAIEKQAGAS